MLTRLWLAILVLGAAGAYLHDRPAEATRAPEAGLAQVPMTIGDWRGANEAPFDDDTMKVLGVDEYINRRYVNARSDALVGLYVGYYRSQRQGDAIHSPLNCLPGTGWQPVDRSRVEVPVDRAAPITANRLVVEKGAERQVVMYWYAGRGRTVAGEYTNKILLLGDAVRTGRTDGALVRVMTPASSDAARADTALRSFIASAHPAVQRRLPSAP
jgi:EpsI family protein